MMLIIEIHVDTIEYDEKSPSTRKKRGDERPTGASQQQKTAGNRFWDAIKLSIPGSLITQNENEK
jgi:hypothetical protein